MDTAAGQSDYPIPSDFCCLERVAYDDRERCGAYRLIPIVSSSALLRMREEHEGMTGAPEAVAIVESIASLLLYPVPDAVYHLEVVYHPQPKMM